MLELSTELDDRILRFDGVSVIHPDLLASAFLKGVAPSQLRVTHITPDVERFNANVEEREALHLAQDEQVKLDFSWQLPEPHLSMDLQATVVARAVNKLIELDYPRELHEKAIQRIQDELDEIERRGMVEFVKTIIYILDVFRKEGVVWGVGRGSSCASYVLFILGLHLVDCVKYNVPHTEFFHD